MYPFETKLSITIADQVVFNIGLHEESSMIPLNVAYTVYNKHEDCIEDEIH